jgi:hypothetical protein
MLPKMSYSQTLSITEVQRDSIFNKIQRGVINAERVVHLRSALNSCDSVKKIQTDIIGVLEFQNKSKDIIITNNQVMIKLLKENATLEKKRGRKKAFWSFIKGVGVGAGLATAAIIVISI